MEDNSYKENLMKSPSLDENGGHDGNVSSHGTAGECGGTVDAEDVENNSQVEGFLYIPVSRLIFLSMLTFGLYCYYWQYRNWGYVKEREGLSISPFWRAWFWLFFVYALLKAIKKDPYYHQVAQPSFSPLLLAIVAIFSEFISQLINRLPYHAETIAAEMVALMMIGAHLAFIPVQLYVNRCEQKLHSGNTMKSAWSKGHVFCYVWTILALIIWVLSGLA